MGAGSKPLSWKSIKDSTSNELSKNSFGGLGNLDPSGGSLGEASQGGPGQVDMWGKGYRAGLKNNFAGKGSLGDLLSADASKGIEIGMPSVGANVGGGGPSSPSGSLDSGGDDPNEGYETDTQALMSSIRSRFGNRQGRRSTILTDGGSSYTGKKYATGKSKAA